MPLNNSVHVSGTGTHTAYDGCERCVCVGARFLGSVRYACMTAARRSMENWDNYLPSSSEPQVAEEEDQDDEDLEDEYVTVAESSGDEGVKERKRQEHVARLRRMKRKMKTKSNSAPKKQKPPPITSHRRPGKPSPFSDANPRPVDMVSKSHATRHYSSQIFSHSWSP